MNIAIWIIAFCSLIRIVQNGIQLHALKGDTKARDNAYAEFVKSLKKSDKEFIECMAKELLESIDDGK